MRYIQFYQWGALSGLLIPACGDRSVIILDGRERLETGHKTAIIEGQKRGYPGFNIWEGESFTRSKPRYELVYPTSGSYGTYPADKIGSIY